VARPSRRPKRGPAPRKLGPDWHPGTERWIARPGHRIGARVVDAATWALVLMLCILVVGPASRLALLVAALTYTLVVETLLVAFLGGSIGKLLVRLRVIRRSDGRDPPGVWAAFRRQALPALLLGGILILIAVVSGSESTIDWLANASEAAVVILSLWWLFTDPERRSVFDRFGGTIVVRHKDTGPPHKAQWSAPSWTN